MALNALKKLREDLENNTSQILGDVTKTAAYASSAGTAGIADTSGYATTAAEAGTAYFSDTSAFSGTAAATMGQ